MVLAGSIRVARGDSGEGMVNLRQRYSILTWQKLAFQQRFGFAPFWLCFYCAVITENPRFGKAAWPGFVKCARLGVGCWVGRVVKRSVPTKRKTKMSQKAIL